MRNILLLSAVSAALAASSGLAPRPATIEATVLDQRGSPVEGAVVFAISGAVESPPAKTVEMTMKGMEFDPAFSSVSVGDSVSFPNQDSTHHHVYSFSKTKKFDSRLYKDGAPKVVEFDKPGLVTVGCKIHDWMKGTILVTPSALRAVTGKDGKAELRMQAGPSVKLGVYHPRLRGKPEKHDQEITLKDGKGAATWKLPLKKESSGGKRPHKVYY